MSGMCIGLVSISMYSVYDSMLIPIKMTSACGSVHYAPSVLARFRSDSSSRDFTIRKQKRFFVSVCFSDKFLAFRTIRNVCALCSVTVGSSIECEMWVVGTGYTLYCTNSNAETGE